MKFVFEVVLPCFAVFLATVFASMYFVRHRNRGSFPGFHRHPENLRRKRNEPVEAPEITQGWQI